MKTVLITGCSSGFGLEIAKFFLDKGWRAVATMRSPRSDILPSSSNLTVLALDVRDAENIRAAVEAAGPIDVLVNNAGIGWMNVLEGTPMETVRDLFETNIFGTIAMMQAVLPQFRERREGVIVNVSSSVTLKPLPLLPAYTASKAAVNALTESAALELEPFNVRVRLVLPGRAPQTSFGDTARTRLQGQGGFPEPYSDFVAGIFRAREQQADAPVTHPADVVAAVWQAATDPASPMRIPAGADAVALSG
ncbi:NAD(P)-dependent dehydrogenase (short-subunit alcohol dehydrogenase family) [Pseudorhizobium tarimense]|uniref:NAD(P)-dependent dehydrogenase (Short-subunit alcohol dehydrogenase family) n=1 Tax=Pseudorhizobium tarimense TaxID=1079109 RepID=A0ABV2HA32_9HYPH|nr:SDR family oxidoreductase [Pseudorhizobium tarimense]MCJ8520575.1 SDR family oxidoreductase [Pseudorhizobium tarimense]